jgi:hypothetical protein
VNGGNIACVRLLLENGANVMAETNITMVGAKKSYLPVENLFLCV